MSFWQVVLAVLVAMLAMPAAMLVLAVVAQFFFALSKAVNSDSTKGGDL